MFQFKKWALRGGIAILLLGTGAGMTAIAQTATQAAGGRTGPLRAFLQHERAMLTNLRSDLGLTADQKQQIRQILVSHRTEIASDAKPLVDKFRALRTAVDGGDETAIRAAAKDMTDPLADAAVLASKIKAETRAVLTPDQQAKMDTFRQQTADGVDALLEQIGQTK